MTGLSVRQLAVSRHTLWALSPEGEVYWRHGVTETDWAGGCWGRVSAPPGRTTAIAASQCDTVWALDTESGIHQLEVLEFGADPKIEESNTGDWTLI